jgi:hypothetical protein
MNITISKYGGIALTLVIVLQLDFKVFRTIFFKFSLTHVAFHVATAPFVIGPVRFELTASDVLSICGRPVAYRPVQ